jgi:hypothetical protein
MKAKDVFLRYMQCRNETKGSGEAKVFCIGLNKTGTTSIEKALKELGYQTGNQTNGELLIDQWAQRNFQPIIDLCYSADAFQDIPFSLPFTYQALDQAFPNAKFILTVRDNAETWYESLTRFHSKLWTNGRRIPTEKDLKNAFYLRDGYVARMCQCMFDTPNSDPYCKNLLLAHYERHLSNVRDYFRFRPDKLLEINIGKDDDYQRLCRFLGKDAIGNKFPWLNKT